MYMNVESMRLKREMKNMTNIVPKHVLKSLNQRLTQLLTDECITVTIPNVELQVSCVWDDGDTPTLEFSDLGDPPEDMLEDATDDELKRLGLSSIIELRERIQKEINDWNQEVERLEKTYSIEEDMLADFFLGGFYENGQTTE